EVKEFRIGPNLVARATLKNQEIQSKNPIHGDGVDSPVLDLDFSATEKAFRLSGKAKIEQQAHVLLVHSANVRYDTIGMAEKTSPMHLSASLSAKADLANGGVTAEIDGKWKNPSELISEIAARKTRFELDSLGMK